MIGTKEERSEDEPVYGDSPLKALFGEEFKKLAERAYAERHEHCLDKERVRKAILTCSVDACDQYFRIDRDKFFKELGL